MIKTMMIGDHPVEINSSAGWLYCYREQFGHDIMADLYPLMASVASAATKLLQGAVRSKGGDVEEIKVSEIMKNVDEDVVQDALIQLSSMESTTVLNILWALAKNATPDLEQPQRFANKFDPLPMEQVVPEMFKAIVESSASSKNSQSLLEILKKVKNLSVSIQ